MGLLRSLCFGGMAWLMATSLMFHPKMALAIATAVAFLSETTHHGAELRRMQRQSNRGPTNFRVRTARWMNSNAPWRAVILS